MGMGKGDQLVLLWCCAFAVLSVTGSACSGTTAAGSGGADSGVETDGSFVGEAGPRGEAGGVDADTSTDGATTPDASPTIYGPVVLDFDDLPSQTVITNQYAAHVTFSSEPQIPITAERHIDIGQSKPNYMSAGNGSDVDHPLFVAFAKPVRNLKLKALSVTDTGTVAHIRVLSNAKLLATVDLVGKGDSFVPVAVDLSSYLDVTRIEVVDITDTYGIVYDDFSFDFPK